MYRPAQSHHIHDLRNGRFTRGFTLVELMVVLVILAIVGAMVSFGVSAGNGHALESAAVRLSATLEEARWRAISTGQRIALEIPQAGSAPHALQWHEQMQDGTWRIRELPTTDATLAGVAIQITVPRPVADAPSRLVLGPEPVGVPSCVLLTQDSNAVSVSSDGITPFAVQLNVRC